MPAKEGNYKILKQLLAKERQMQYHEDQSKCVLLIFLYKYLSDNLKSYLMGFCDNITLKEAYLDNNYYNFFKKNAIEYMGYFFRTYDAFIANNEIDFNLLKSNICCIKDSNFDKYINQVFKIIGEIDMSPYSSIISLIFKLNLFEDSFTFKQVFNIILDSKLVQASTTPEYISELLYALTPKNPYNIYNPFLEDASSIVNFKYSNIYGKEKNEINYLSSLVKVFIENSSFDNFFFFNEDATESVMIDDLLFDVVISNVDNNIKNSKQNLEIPSHDKFKEKILNELELDENNLEIKKTINKLIDFKIYNENICEFNGDFELLKDSEFLFLINMINCLKNDGIMIISIPQNFLFKNSLTLLRKFLTYEKNYIDAVITLPEELGKNVMPKVILIFKKNRTTNDILFIDVSGDYKTTISKNTIQGSFKRKLILDKSTLNKILSVYSKRQVIDKFSNLIKIDEIESNDFNLSALRYVDTYDGEFIKLADLTDEKKKIDTNIKLLNDKIDKLMDDLDIKF